MSDETETAIGESATLLNGLVNNCEDRTQRVHEAARSLHSDAVKELCSLGVCERCIFRLVAVGPIDSYCSSVSTPTLRSCLEANDDEAGSLEFGCSGVCIVCLGILQFVFTDVQQTLVKLDSCNDYAARITELVKQDGHKFDSFGLEVSVPSVITENERAVLSYLKGKYSSEGWLKSEIISVKDALKSLVLDTLKTLLGARSDSSSLHIILTYSKSLDEAQSASETTHERKRRKTDAVNGSNDMLEDSFEKVYKPCLLSVHCNKTPIYFSGRYFKYSRNVSQSRWIIDDERMGEASVEEIIGGSILPACLGEAYKFHAAGREDIDVRMLGSGRPFLIEVQNYRQCPSDQLLAEVEAKINNSEKKLVGVKDLRFVGSQCWAMMREGEAEKQKQYVALVWTSRPLEEKDIHSISSLKELKILQKTPVRVLHRRSPLDREKIIHWMKVEKIKGSDHYFLLHLCTQAGTYIKEFVHGDLGRTTPSMGSILGCRAEILQLDVTDVKMGDLSSTK